MRPSSSSRGRTLLALGSFGCGLLSFGRRLGVGRGRPRSRHRDRRAHHDALSVKELDHLLGLLGRKVLRQGRIELVEGDGAAVLGLDHQPAQLRIVLQDCLQPVADMRLGDGLGAHG